MVLKKPTWEENSEIEQSEEETAGQVRGFSIWHRVESGEHGGAWRNPTRTR